MYKDDDVLDVLNSNTQNNNYNEDTNKDELGILNSNIQDNTNVVKETVQQQTQPVEEEEESTQPFYKTNKYLSTATGIGSDEEEKLAEQQGALDVSAGIIHTSMEDIVQSRRASNSMKVAAGQEGKPVLDHINKLEKNDALDASDIYVRTLGSTAYEELKYACGLSKYASFTDYYNKTKFIPKGFEVEARLCLAEEKRMKYFAQYESGEISKSDFLYQAYGKDLMKEAGYDLSSAVFWYNKYKNGDYTNPLDNDLFLSELIASAEDIFEKEDFYKKSSEKQLSDTLAGIVTGKWLSTEKVEELFKSQIDALKPYFDNDAQKVINAYKAGSLGNAFSPFIDIDGDNKVDYYYHINGKLYAVQDSSGKGNATCVVKYNDDGGIHSVEIQEGLTGAGGAIFEGLAQVVRPVIDLVFMADNLCGITAVVNWIQEGKWDWVDAQQDYRAAMSTIFSDEDVKIFDGGHEWGYEIPKAAGTILGQVIIQVVLALLTYGGGNAGYSAGKAAGSVAAKVGAVAGRAAVGAAVGAGIGAGVGAGVEAVRGGDDLGGAALTGAGIGAGLGAAIGVGTGVANMLKHGTETTLKETAKVTARRSSAFFTKIYGNLMHFNTGSLFNGGTVWGRVGNATLLAIKDGANTAFNLLSTNRVLKYYEDAHPELGIKPLSNAEILGRIGITMGTDIIVSSMMRLQQSQGGAAGTPEGTPTGITGFFRRIGTWNNNSINTANWYLNNLNWAPYVDNVFDIIENMLTMGTMAAVNNPYAALGSQDSFATFGKSMISVQSIMSNLYISARNFLDWDIGPIKNKSTITSVYEAYQRSLGSAADNGVAFIKYIADNSDNDVVIRGCQEKLKEIDAIRNPQGSSINAVARDEQIIQAVSDFLDIDTLNKMDPKFKNEFYKLFGINDQSQLVDLNKLFENLQEKSKASGIDDSKRAAAIYQYKNMTKGAGKAQKVQFGQLGELIMFHYMKKESTKIAVQYMNENIDSMMKMATKKSDTWQSIWKNGFVSTDDTKRQFRSAMKYVAKTMKQRDKAYSSLQAHIDMLNKKIEKIIDRKAIQATQKDIEDNCYVTFEGFWSALSNYKLQLVEDPTTGGYKVLWLDSDNNQITDGRSLGNLNKGSNKNLKNLFISVLSDKDCVNTLVNSGAIKLKQDGTIDISDSFSETPWVMITQNPNKVNDIRASDELTALFETLENVSKLSTTLDENGERLIKGELPSIVGVDYKKPNGETTRVYFIPSSKGMSSADAYARMMTTIQLIYSMRSFSNPYATQDDINKSLMFIGLAQVGDSAMMATIADDGEIPEDQQVELINKGIVALSKLVNVKDVKQTGKALNRSILLQLCSFDNHPGVINQEQLKTILNNAQDYGLDPQTQDNIRALDSYITKLKELKDATAILTKYANNYENGRPTYLKPSEQKVLMDLKGELTKPENAWLKEALQADNQITSDFIKAIINGDISSVPFLKGLKELGTSLARSNLSERDGKAKTLTDRAMRIFLEDTLDDYLYSEKTVRGNIIKGLRTALGRMQNEIQSDFNRKDKSYAEASLNGVGKGTNQIIDNVSSANKESLFSLYQNIGENFEVVNEDQQNLIKIFHQANSANYDELNLLYTESCTIKDILKMSDKDLVDFLFNPKLYLENLKSQEEAFRLDHPNYDKLKHHDYSSAIDKLQERFNNTQDLFLSYVSTLDANASSSADSLYRTMLSDKPSILKDVIATLYMASTGEKSFDANNLVWDKKTETIQYNGKDLIQTIVNSDNDISKELITEMNSNVIDMIMQDIDTYSHYILDDTKEYASRNVISVNLLEFLPSKYVEILDNFKLSKELSSNFKEDSREISRAEQAIRRLISSEDAGKLDAQMIKFVELAITAINKGSYIIEFSLDDEDKFMHLAASLGYNKEDLYQARYHQKELPGVIYKNRGTNGVESKLGYIQLFDELKKHVDIKFQEGTYADVTKNAVDYFTSAFRNAYRIDMDSELDIDSSTLIYGIENMFEGTSEPVDGWSSWFLDNIIKRGLGGAQSVEDIQYQTKAITFSEKDPMSLNTFAVLKAISALKNYYDKDMPAVLTYRVPKNYAWMNRIEEFYKNNPNSLFVLYSDETNLKDGIVAFKYNPNFDFEKYQNSLNGKFDINTLIPMWFPKNTATIKSDNAGTLRLPIEILRANNVDGCEIFKDVDSLINARQSSVSIYGTSKRVYANFINSLQDKKVSTILNAYAKANSNQRNNYFVRMLVNSIQTGLRTTEIVNQQLSKTGIAVFASPAMYKGIGAALNKDETLYNDFNKLISYRHTDAYDSDEYKQLLSNVTSRLNSYLANNKESNYYNIKNDNVDYFADGTVSSATLSRLRPITNVKDIKLTDTDVDNLINVVGTHKNVVIGDEFEALPKHNDLVESLIVLNLDENQNAYLDLDDFNLISNEAKKALLSAIDEIINDPDSALDKSELKRFKNAITKKVNILEQIGADRQMFDENGNFLYPSHERINSQSQGMVQANVNITSKEYLANTLHLSDDEASKVAKYLDNAYLGRTLPHKFIKASALTDYDPDYDYSPLTKMYNDMLNITLLRNVDKGGSDLVYNLTCKEAIGELFNSIASFANALYQSDIFSDKFKGIKVIENGVQRLLSEEEVLGNLMEVAFHSNLYSTGTDYESIYAGSLIVEWDPEDFKGFKINPLVISSKTADDDITSYMLYGEKNISAIKDDTKHAHIMIQLDKNAFSGQIANYKDSVVLYNLDDQNQRDNFLRYAMWQTYHKDLIKNGGTLPEHYSLEDAMAERYQPKMNTVTITKQMKDIARQMNVSERMVDLLSNTIYKLSVSASSNNRGQEIVHQVLDELSRRNSQLFTNEDENREIASLCDILVRGVTYEGLDRETVKSIDDLKDTIEDKLTPEARNAALGLLDDKIEDKTFVREQLNNLTDEQLGLALKYAVVCRSKGKDLEYMLSGKNYIHQRILNNAFKDTDTYYSVYNPTTNKIELRKFESKFNDERTIYNALTKGKWIGYDTEWLIGAGKKLYQIGFIVGDPLSVNDRNKYTDQQSYEKHVILLKDAFLQEATQVSKEDAKTVTTGAHYLEDKSEFDIKRSYVSNNVGSFTKDGVTYHIVADEAEARDVFFQYLGDKEIQTLFGYNNQSRDISTYELNTDDFWLDKDARFKTIMQSKDNIDIRLQMADSIYSKELEGYVRDSLDYYRKHGIITSTRTAHDALSDIEDTLALYKTIANSRFDSKDMFNEEENELTDLVKNVLGKDESRVPYIIGKALDFSDDFTDEQFKHFKDTYNIGGMNKNTSMLKLALDLYNTKLASENRKVLIKAADSTVERVLPHIDEFDMFREKFATDYLHANNAKQIIFNLTNAFINDITMLNGSRNLTDDEINRLRNIYSTKVNRYVEQTIDKIFKPTYEANIGQKISFEKAKYLFFTQDSKDILNQLKSLRTAQYDFKSKDIERGIFDMIPSALDGDLIVNKKNIDAFEKIYNNNLLNESTISLRDSEINGLKVKIDNDVIKPIIETCGGIDAIKDSTFFNHVINSVVNIFGQIDDSFDSTKNLVKNNHFVFTSKIQDDVLEYIITSLKDELYTVRAAYIMFNEHREFDENIPEGTVSMGEKTFFRMFDDIAKDSEIIKTKDGKRYTYVQIWRQPGQGKVMHTLRIELKKGTGVSMSTATAKSYFNGDFDGDYYNVAKPTAESVEFGESMFDEMTEGWKVLSLFNDGTRNTLKKNDVDNINNAFYRANSLIKNQGWYGRFLNVINKLHGKNALAIDDARKLVSQLQKDFTDALIGKGLTQTEAKEVWKYYGLKIRDMKQVNGVDGEYIVTSSNYLLGKNKDIYQLLDANNKAFIHSAQFSNDYDSQIVGNIAKLLKNENKIVTAEQGRLSDILVNSSILLSADSIDDLQLRLSKSNVNVVKDKLTTYIKNTWTKFLGNKDGIVDLVVKSINDADSIDAYDVIGIAQMTQELINYSDDYNSRLDGFAKQYLSKNNEELANRAYALQERLALIPGMTSSNNKYGDFNDTRMSREEISKMSNPQLLQLTSKYVQMLNKANASTAVWAATKKNSRYTNYLINALTNEADTVKAKEWCSIVDPKNAVQTVNSTGKAPSFGIGEVTVAVPVKPDKAFVDTMFINRDNKAIIRHAGTFNASRLQQDWREHFSDPNFRQEEFTGTQLENMLGTNNFKSLPNATYTVVGFANGRIKIVESSKLFDYIMANGWAKVATDSGKSFKGTVGYDEELSNAFKGQGVDFVVPQDLFNQGKQGLDTGYEDLHKVVEINGNKYALYNVNNVAILNSASQISNPFKERAIDIITMLQTNHAVDALISTGQFFFELDENGNVRYNPTGMNEFVSSLSQMSKPSLTEVNGMSELRSLQLYSLLKNMPDELVQRILPQFELGTTDLETTMQKVYGNQKVGGNYGDALINIALMELASKSEKEIAKVFEAMKKDPLASKVWRRDVVASTETNKQTTSNMFDENGNLNVKEFRSKYKTYVDGSKQTSIRNASSLDRMYESQNNSGIDYNNGRWYGMRSLRDLLTGRDYTITKSDDIKTYQYDLLKARQLHQGSQTNSFNAFRDDEGLFLGDKQELYPQFTPDLKTGAVSNLETYQEVTEPTSFINVIDGQNYSRDTTPINDYMSMYSSTYNPNLDTEGRTDKLGKTHQAIASVFSDYSNDGLIRALTNNEQTAEGILSTPYIKATDTGLKFGAREEVFNTDKYANYKKEINEERNSAILMQYKTLETQIRKQRFSEIKNFESFKLISEAIAKHKQIIFDDDINAMIAKYYQSSSQFENAMSFTEYSERKSKYTDDFYETMSALYDDNAADFNNVEVRKSITSSSGFRGKNKASDGVDLGYQTVNLKNFKRREFESIAGEEYYTLTEMFSHNKVLRSAVDQYVKAKALLDLYDALMDPTISKRYIKANGQYAYNKAVEQAKIYLTKNDVNNFETRLAEYRANIKDIEDTSEFKDVIGIVKKLNERVAQEARKEDPNILLGYYLPLGLNNKQKKMSLIGNKVACNRIFTENIDKIFKSFGSQSDGSDNKLLALFNNDETGYYNMITNAMSSIAQTRAMRNFSSFLRQSGYMNNSELYLSVFDYANKNLFSKFNESLENYSGNEKRYEYDKETFNILKNAAYSAGVNVDDVPDYYMNPKDFGTLYSAIIETESRMKDQLKDTGFEYAGSRELREKALSAKGTPNESMMNKAVDIDNIKQNMTACMIAIMKDNGKIATVESFLTDVYKHAQSVAGSLGKVLVDMRGAKLDNDLMSRYSYKPLDFESIIDLANLSSFANKEAEFGKMLLCGDVYLMDASVADQLSDKVFTERVPGIIGKAFNTAREFVTGFIMSTPFSLIDRLINFTMFDLGTLGRADIHVFKEFPEAFATIKKYCADPEAITPEAINSDQNLQYLLRYIAATGQMPTKTDMYMGDKYNVTSIPGIKQWMKFAGNQLAQQQFYVRFAYFMDLVKSGEANGNKLDPTRVGVAYHLIDGLNEMNALGNEKNEVYKYILKDNENAFYDYDNPEDQPYLKSIVDLDAAAVQVVAENVGIFGNMPYGSTMLSRLGMMFTGFPLAAIRWGSNRIQSLAYAFSGQGDQNMKYLLNNLGSTAMTAVIMLAIQILLSGDTENTIKKYLYDKKDEITDEEKKNAENILFRGGCVKLFDTLLQGEEKTNTGHSTSPIAHMFDSYVSDFIFKDEDDSFMDSLGNMLKKNIWGHQNVIIKDPIESIPGNTWLQSTSWYTPGENWFDNMGRKVAGYVMGSSQANSFADSWDATKYEKDKTFFDRVKLGMQKAYIEDNTKLKEYKSAFRNYKKALSLVSDYNRSLYDQDDGYSTSSSGYSKGLYYEVQNALKQKSSPSAIYNILQKYLSDSSVSIVEVRNTLNSLSLRNKLKKVRNVDEMLSTMSSAEQSCIKSALAYEDDTFPYLINYVESVEEKYKNSAAYKATHPTSTYTKSIASILKTMNYNTPKLYRNSNYNRYYKSASTYNYLRNNNYGNKNRTLGPSEIYDQMINRQNNAVSTDIWGNKTRHYTDGTSYQIRQPGLPIEVGGTNNGTNR